MSYILHVWDSKWGIPSLNPSCTHIEAYLRFSGVEFSVNRCKSPFSSPTGVLPYLEVEDDVGIDDETASKTHIDGADSASIILQYLQKQKGLLLDTHLSLVEAAELEAFTTLIETKLATATVYFTWVDSAAYRSHTEVDYGASLPALLNRYIPWRWRSAICKRLSGKSASQVIEQATDAYKAIASRLGSRKYFFGNKVTSLDALLFAHLSHHLHAPGAASPLTSVLEKYPELGRFVCSVNEEFFSHAISSVPTPQASSTASTAAQKETVGGLKDPAESTWWSWFSSPAANPKTQLSEKEYRYHRRSRAFLAFMGSALFVYLVKVGYDAESQVEASNGAANYDSDGSDQDDQDE